MSASCPPSDVTAPLRISYHGQARPLFKLALRTGLLTLISFGIYRFWAKTRLRRYIWSATTPDGIPLEYTGTGPEKLLGFLIALVVLTAYLGVVQTGLFLLGLSVFSADGGQSSFSAQTGASLMTLLALLPLMFLARYQRRRYQLSRTRWRGIRFGMAPAAFGYMWRALALTGLTVLSCGLLLPYQIFVLEKFMTERSFFGTARFTQSGHWTMLLPAMKPLAMGIAMMGLSAGCAMLIPVLLVPLIGLAIGYLLTAFGMVHFAVNSFNLLTSNKQLGDTITLTAALRTGDVLRRLLTGGMATLAIALVFVLPVTLLFIGVGVTSLSPAFPSGAAALTDPVVLLLGAAALVAYLVISTIIGSALLAFMAHPLMRYTAEHVTFHSPWALGHIRQRPATTLDQADGIAQALDFGGTV